MIEQNPYDLLKEDMIEKKIEWLDFLESWFGKSEYIAELGFPHRKKTKNLEHTFRQLLFFGAEMRNDVYSTVYVFRKMKYVEHAANPQRKHIPDYSSAFINKAYWELDFTHKKQGCMQDAYDDCMKLMDYFNNECRVYYTTGKGFHIYVDLLLSITKIELREYTRFIIDGLKLETADCGFIGDISRIMRVPYFIHSKTKQFILPVTRNMSLQYMIENSKTCFTPIKVTRKPLNLSERWGSVNDNGGNTASLSKT